MKQLLLSLLFIVFACALCVHARAAKEETGPVLPGGDVLRPSRVVTTEYKFYAGPDGGLTYSTFQNGPLNFYSPNPHNSLFPLESTIRDGNGLGFTIGGTIDFPISDAVGIVGKLSYHTRTGAFDEQNDIQWVHPDTRTGLTTILRDEVDWTFQFISLDILARIQFLEKSVYLLVGPSIGSLRSNSMKLTQTITRPEDIYYVQESYITHPTDRMLKTATAEETVAGFTSLLMSLKAGIGTWIPLSDDLYLTPEVILSYPLSELVESSVSSYDFYNGYYSEKNAVFDRVIGDPLFPISQTEIKTNKDFNTLAIFVTIGIRWTINLGK